MKTLDTTPGSEYAVKSAAGCDVYTPSGQVICRIMPGILGSFCASTYVTCLSDAAATVTLVSSGAPGGTGGNTLTISQALDAANRAESAADRAEAGASAAEMQAQGATVANTAARAALAGAQAAEANAEAAAQASATSESNATAAAQASATSEANAAEAAAAAAADAAEAEASAARTREAAWPAVMVLLRDELLQLVGEGHFDLDRDGEKIVVHTDRLGDPELAAVNDMLERFVPGFIDLVRYNHNIEVSWRDLNKYAECVTVADLEAVNPEWKHDITSEGEWIYPLTKWPNPTIGPNGTGGIFTPHGVAGVISLRFFTEANYNASSGYLAADNKNLKRAVVIQPNLPHIRYYFQNCANLEEVEFYLNETATINVYNALSGCVALRKLRLVLPKGVSVDHGGDAVNAAYLCRQSRLDSESVIRLLNSLPDKSASSTAYQMGLGIHSDYEQDEELLAAIAAAEAKNWSLTIVWKGTATVATASTFGLRGPLIYAKVGEMELPDGTTERVLDWGHYVTNETGYETFRSLESAYEYFGLPMPEEDLAATE